MPPNPLPHMYAPLAAENLAAKASQEPLLVIGPPPKSTVPWNPPTTTTLPLESVSTPKASSVLAPPRPLAQRYAPVAEYFATKASQDPLLLSDPPPKFTVPEK